MKQILVMMAVVVLVGCGEKDDGNFVELIGPVNE